MKLRQFLLVTLSFILLTGSCMTACNGKKPDVEDPEQETTAPTGQGTEPGTDPEPEPGPDDPGYVEPVITGPYADTIMYANKLADGVQAYYANPARTTYRIENQNMRLNYNLSSASDMLVTSLTNAAGGVYLENTMDVFITMEDGKTYLASESTAAPHTNIYRMSYYYYDTHIMGQNFMGSAAVTDQMEFAISKGNMRDNDVADFKVSDGVISYTVTGFDPYVYTVKNTKKKGLYYQAEQYNAVQFSVKTAATSGELYFIAGDRTGHNAEQCVRFNLVGDGEWNTYTLVLSNAVDYTGAVTSLRFDIGGSGDTVQIKDIKAIALDMSAPAVLLDRTFHTYSDKMNQVLHFVATEYLTGIDSMGMITKISANTVDKLIVKDKNGTHTSLDGVDFDSCEYVGFDIKGVGILGFILLPHENSGRLEITLSDGVYTVTQSACPKGGELYANPDSTGDDFYMGHRLYTDESHSFDAFLIEAEYERNPLQSVQGDAYVGYDALRGAYRYSIGGTGFNEPFFSEQNRHYSSDISITAESDRKIYAYTTTTSGCGENALILGKDDLLLPIPVMICKNFKGENEEPIYDPGDPSYSETYFPISLKAGETVELTVLNLYMNWGQIPLKQLSSIQYFWPYYHLSLGTTETSCISPLYGARDLWTLPDFRSMSMPYWFELPKGQGYSNQPQHTHGGFQYFLQYTDAEGNYSATENYHNNIISSGPTYTDVKMDYISDDGKIKVSYNHVELPETDELRAYYEINYEVLADISIADFAKDFSFYSLEGYAGAYKKIGYLGAGNKVVQGTVNASATPEVLKLGDQYPYVALYDLEATAEDWANNNVNLGFVIYGSEMTIGGQKCDAGFVLVGQNSKYSLSLDLENVTLKAGDTMKLCLIISPWGFYTSTDDSNMQEIRENTCINGVKLTVQDGEAVDSVFVPSVKSSNGKSAEFTISGGSNNKAVRIYGFDKLTAPVIYEKIDGEWVELTINSSKTPDSKGYSHYYDGYTVYYDRNGTYSYAFAFNMDGVDSRTFKIVCEQDFAGWPETEQKPEQGTEQETPSAPPTFSDLVDASSGYSVSDVRFTAFIDFINGAGDGDGPYNSRGSSSDKGLDIIDYNGSTVDGGKLALAGWAVARGGIDKYVWSAYGGKTWQDCTLYGRDEFSPLTEGSGIANAGNSFLAGSGYDVMEHPDKIVFQGAEGAPSGVCADLAGYAGQTVDVVFAIVPNNDPKGLCVITVVKGVAVED